MTGFSKRAPLVAFNTISMFVAGIALSVTLSACQQPITLPWQKPADTTGSSTPNAGGTTSSGDASALPPSSGQQPAKLDATTKALFDAAVAESKKKNWAGAITGYNKVLAIAPNHVDSLANLGWMYAEQKNWEAAKSNLNKALSIDPNNANALANLGWAYAEEKAWDKALAVLNKAVQSNPNHAGAYTNLGWVHAEKGEWDASVAASQKATQLDPKNAYAYANLGWALKGQKKTAEALAAYQKAVSLNPNNGQAILAIGMTYCEQGKKPQALEQSKILFQKDGALGTQLNTRIAKGCP